MNKYIKLLKQISLVLLTIILVSCSKNSTGSNVFRTVQEIKDSGVINIGVPSDSPSGYVDENGEYQGYDIYFARRIGQDLGVKVNLISTEAVSRIEYLQTGKADLILCNFTVTAERAKEVDFALPYMKVTLGLVSHNDRVITSLEDIKENEEIIITAGTTAQNYLEANYPNIKLQKYDSFTSAISAFENKNGVAWANDNTEVIAFALANPNYTVGISSFGGTDTIAPAVAKGNESLLNWVNEEIVNLGKENFFHKNYEETLLPFYGKEFEETFVVEGGVINDK